MIIYALSNDYDDHREFGGRTSPRTHSSGSPHDTQTINVLRNYTIEWLANDIKNRVDAFRSATGRTDTKIWLLRMESHGNAGQMFIGRGLNRETASEFGILAENYFVPYDEGGQGIELWGCCVASARTINPAPRDIDLDGDGTLDGWSPEAFALFQSYNSELGHITAMPDIRRGSSYPSVLRGTRDISGSVEEGRGYRMMNVLAQAADTKVTAAYDIQLSELDGADWQWEGTGLLTVFPGGGYEMTPLA